MKPELKQHNKKHKTGVKSKRQLKSQTKGRIEEVCKPNKKSKNANKSTRKAQRKQKIKQQLQEIALDHASYGGPSGPPILCVVIPLDTAVSPWMLRSLIKSCVPDETWREPKEAGEAFHFAVTRFKKRLALRLASYSNLFATLDLAKVADVVIFAVKSLDTLAQDEYAQTLLSALYSQGLPRCLYTSLSPSFDLHGLRKLVESRFPVEKNQFWAVHNEASTQLFLRHVCQSLPSGVALRNKRAFMLVERFSVVPGESEELLVSGHLRGKAFNVNSFVHVTGLGDFAVLRVDRQVDPNPARPRATPDARDVDAVPLATRSAPVEIEVEEVEMEEPEGEESDELEEEVEDIMSEDEEEDELEEADEDEGDSDEDMSVSDAGSDGSQNTSMAEDGPDPRLDKDLERFRRAREEAQFPDEVDSPLDQPVRERFRRYRGLNSLLTSGQVDPSCLPSFYKSLVNFPNYRHARNRISKLAASPGTDNPDLVPPGAFLRLLLRPLRPLPPQARPVVLFSLLPLENRLSVVHCSLRSVLPTEEEEEEEEESIVGPQMDFRAFDAADVGEFHPEERAEQRRAAARAPVRSKDAFVVQLGFRRILTRPIFSEDGGAATWHRFRRFLTAEPAVASLVAPVAFTPCPALFFRGACRELLVATGSVKSCAPRRWCLKRVLLSGHPLKNRGRSAVVRYMFFNADDVDYYKALEVRTKNGRRGRIVESLGTHGLMKCKFDRNLTKMDVVTMALYKPMYPKDMPVDAALYRLKEPSFRHT